MSKPTPELLAALSKALQGIIYDCADKMISLGTLEEEALAILWPIVQAREQAAAQRAIEEHEAALCPEDYGCKEYIAHLEKREQAARLEEARWWHGRKGTCPSATSDECCRRIAALEPKEPRG